MRYVILLFMLLCPQITAAFAADIPTQLNGCNLILQPTEIRQNDEMSYAFNLLSTTSDNDKRLNIFGELVGQISGSMQASYSNNELKSSVTQNINYYKEHDFMSKFLSKDQLDKYIECIKIKRGGFAAVIQDFDDASVKIKVSYIPGEDVVGAPPFRLREKIKISGVENNNAALEEIPEHLLTNGKEILSFKRKKGFRFHLL
jgi:hypothetical protein